MFWFSFLTFLATTLLGATWAKKIQSTEREHDRIRDLARRQREIEETTIHVHKGEMVVPITYGQFKAATNTINFMGFTHLPGIKGVPNFQMACDYCGAIGSYHDHRCTTLGAWRKN